MQPHMVPHDSAQCYRVTDKLDYTRSFDCYGKCLFNCKTNTSCYNLQIAIELEGEVAKKLMGHYPLGSVFCALYSKHVLINFFSLFDFLMTSDNIMIGNMERCSRRHKTKNDASLMSLN